LAQEQVDFPITGKITSVNVQQGSAVKEGDVLCLLESMKMENPIMAPASGVINQINVSPDQAIKSGETIAVIEY